MGATTIIVNVDDIAMDSKTIFNEVDSSRSDVTCFTIGNTELLLV